MRFNFSFFDKNHLIIWSKISISVVSFLYILYLIIGLFFSYLGSNPVEVITHATGEWGLYFLLLTLTVTPLRRHYHLNSLLKLKRFLGLWSFTFIALHFLIFILFDHYLDVNSVIDDIIERPYIAIGFMAFIVMIPLAITSFKVVRWRMGKYWIILHKSIYLVSVLGIIHYWWLVKADIFWPVIFALVLFCLLGDRIYWLYRKKI